MDAEKRRKLLKRITLTVPAVWVRPVVESVLLPAHAVSTNSSGQSSSLLTLLSCTANPPSPAAPFGWIQDGDFVVFSAQISAPVANVQLNLTRVENMASLNINLATDGTGLATTAPILILAPPGVATYRWTFVDSSVGTGSVDCVGNIYIT